MTQYPEDKKKQVRLSYITYKHLLLLSLTILGFICTWACQQVDSYVETGLIGPGFEEKTHLLSFEIEIPPEVQTLTNNGSALGLEIYSLESELLERVIWLDYELETVQDGEENLKIRSLENVTLSEGRYKLHLFFKSDTQNLDDHSALPFSITCPHPFTVQTPLNDNQFDLADVFWEGMIDHRQTLELKMTRQSCGPGDKETVLTGSIFLPTNISEVAQKRLMVHLAPDQETAETRTALSFPLKRFIWSNSLDPRSINFYLNQIPQGSFEVTFFIDSDGDALPTPCDQALQRGGDQWISEKQTFTFEQGKVVNNNEPIRLAYVEQCQDLLTRLGDSVNNNEGNAVSLNQTAIFLGQIKLNSELRTALRLSSTKTLWFSNSQRPLPPYRFVNGKKLLTLQEALISDGRFSIHLDHQDMIDQNEIVIWIDEGNDQTLTPCNDTADRGVDLWWWTGSRIQLSPLLDIEFERPPPLNYLNISRRCDAPQALLELNIQLNFTWPDLSSKRPLILVYEEIVSAQIQETVLRDISEEDLTDTLVIKQRFIPGSYLLSAYIDQDLDGQFIGCSESFLGDRVSTSRALISSLNDLEIKQANLVLSPRDCVETRSAPQIKLISPLTGKTLSRDEVGGDSLSSYQPNILCDSSEVFFNILDQDLFDYESSTEPRTIISQCTPFQEDRNVLQTMPAGRYEVTACVPIAEQIRSDFQGDTCSMPSVWFGRQSFSLTKAPTQNIDIRLTATCQCD